MTPAFAIVSLRSGEAAKFLAVFVSLGSKTTTISLLSSAERKTRGLLRPAAFCIRECWPAQSCEGPCLHSRDDLDRTADLKTELAIGAPLINGDFGKSVRIFVPECHALRQIAEGHGALPPPTRRGKACIERQHGRPQPGHGIAEMVDVNDLRKVVRPVCP